MSRHVVVAAAAVAKVDGLLVTYYQGAVLPEAVDKGSLAHLLAVGLVAPVASRAPSPAAPTETVPGAAGDVEGAAVVVRPPLTALKSDWVEYAVASGWERAAAEDAAKADLIKALP